MNLIEAIRNLVDPAIEEFDAEEKRLATSDDDDPEKDHFRRQTLRRGRNAAWETHHLADRYFMETDERPMGKGNMLRLLDDIDRRFNNGAGDLFLLGDVVDVSKHVMLQDAKLKRSLRDEGFIAPLSIGWGRGPWGGGRYGDGEQILVTDRDGRVHYLMSVIKAVRNAWIRAIDEGKIKS